jgi:hypothetical protein
MATLLADDRGRFAFPSVLAGRYDLTVSASGYTSSALGRFVREDVNRLLDVADGELSTHNRLYVWKLGVISGTVVDDHGAPAVNVAVQALRRESAGGRVSWRRDRLTATDDRGMYRLSGLSPARYVVAVPSASMLVSVATGSLKPSTATGVPSAFYPAAASAAQANLIDVEPGRERSGIDLALRPPTGLKNITGKISGPEAVTTCTIRLTPWEARESPSGVETRTATSAAGGFQFVGVTPGQYLLETAVVPQTGLGRGAGTISGQAIDLSIRGPLPATPSSPTLWAETTVLVDDRDVDVTLALQPGARIFGQLVFDGNAPAPPPSMVEPPGLFVIVTPFDSRDLGSIPLAPVGPELRFETVGLPPGRYELSPWTRFAYPWGLESITVQGREVTGMPLELGTTDMRSVAITLTDRPVQLKGTTRDQKGAAAPNVGVLAFAKDPPLRQRLLWSPSRIVSGRSDQDGAYHLDGLLPGDYFVAALPPDAPAPWAVTEQLDQLALSAATVRLGKGETRILDLQVRAR